MQSSKQGALIHRSTPKSLTPKGTEKVPKDVKETAITVVLPRAERNVRAGGNLDGWAQS